MSTSDERRAQKAPSSAPYKDKSSADVIVSPAAPTPDDQVDSKHPEPDVAQTGSLDLGKQRQKDAPLSTDPAKHVTPHSPSEEFHFPKSN